jgi:hypothetical protein
MEDSRMSEHSTQPDTDLATGLTLDRDDLLAGGKLDRMVQSGEITAEQAAEILQAASRRHTAEHGPDLDTDEEGRITTGGFGSGQGMQKTRTGT